MDETLAAREPDPDARRDPRPGPADARRAGERATAARGPGLDPEELERRRRMGLEPREGGDPARGRRARRRDRAPTPR